MSDKQREVICTHASSVKGLLKGVKNMSRKRLEVAYLCAMHNNNSACNELYAIWDAVEERGYANSYKEGKNQMVMRAIKSIPMASETFPSS